MKKKIGLIAVALMFVFSAFMAGNTGIDYYRQKYGMLGYEVVEIELDAAKVAKLDKSAAAAGKEYTLKGYYNEFVQYAAADPQLCSWEDNGETITVSVLFVDAYTTSSLPGENYEYNTTKGFFRNKYDVKYAENPMKTLFDRLKNYASAEASEFTEEEKATWQYKLAGGVRVNGTLVLEGISKIFPALKDFDYLTADVTYNQSVPKWLSSTDADEYEIVTKDGVKYMRWTSDDEGMSYSYYVPNSVGWGITLGAVVIILVVVLWFVLGRKKDKPDFADYRSMDQSEISSRVENVINPPAPEPSSQTQAKDGYVGSGVFVENGKEVDVFGNETSSAPNDKTTAEDAGADKTENIDPFG